MVARNARDSVFWSESYGRWTGFVDFGREASGKRRRKKIVRRRKADLLDAMKAARRDADDGKPQANERETVARLLRDYLARGIPDDLTVNGRAGYKWAIEKHLVPAIGGRKVRALSADDVDDMLQAKAAAGYSRKTLVHLHQVLARALRWAERRGRVGTNAATLVDTPTGATSRPSRAFTVDEMRAFLDASTGDRLEAAWVTMFYLGLRPGEVFGLTWDAIDFDEGVIDVRASLRRNQADNTLSIEATKTERSRRRLAPHPDDAAVVFDALRRRKREQAAERLAAGQSWRDEGLVFANERGGPLDPSATRRRFKAVARAAGLGERHPHEARHTLASAKYEQGQAPQDVSDWLGHSDIRTGDQVYRHRLTPVVSSRESAYGTNTAREEAE